VTFVDTNIILDIFVRDTRWFSWSSEQLARAVVGREAAINAIVFAELSRGFRTVADLAASLRPLSLVMLPIDDEAAFLAGHRFIEYRRSRPPEGQISVLPDFFIGAHAVTSGMPLLTRDPALFRRYFPDLHLITPETDNG
jgi:predicted nucleic acid-binding protein